MSGDLCPSYDEGAWIYNLLSDSTSNSFEGNIAKVFQHTTWVGSPLLLSQLQVQRFLEKMEIIQRIKLRVESSYNPYVNVDPDKY